MAGIKDLGTLLSSIDPVLDERSFVFCTFPEFHWDDVHQLTLIITQQEAINKNINYESVYKLISLNVHSSLDAVGLTAAFSTKLAEKNISANVVAAYYHDHIFVPEEKAEQALAAISEFRLQSHPVRLK